MNVVRLREPECTRHGMTAAKVHDIEQHHDIAMPKETLLRALAITTRTVVVIIIDRLAFECVAPHNASQVAWSSGLQSNGKNTGRP